MLSITVDTLSDAVDAGDGVTSLREAVAAANATTTADTIQFAPALTAGGLATILLTHGELAITQPLTIIGPGSNLLTLDASGNDPTPDLDKGDGRRVMSAINSHYMNLSLSGLRMTGGDTNQSPGGALYLSGIGTLNDVIIDRNSSFTDGGIRVEGNVTISNSVFEDNDARTGAGGAISVHGNLTLTNSIVTGNTAGSYAGGIDGFFGNLTIDGCIISNNSAMDSGGIHCAPTSLTIRNTTISDNRAIGGRNGGGGLWIDRLSSGYATITSCTISGNEADVLSSSVTSESGGGGIWCVAPVTLSIVDSSISGNVTSGPTGANGGGILLKLVSGFYLTESTVDNNQASGRGGGIYQALSYNVLNITDSTIRDNHTTRAASLGGGVAALTATFTDSIVSGNYTLGDQAQGGGVYSKGLTLVRTSIVGNHTSGYQAMGGGLSSLATISLTDSMVSGNSTTGDQAKGGGIYLGGNSPSFTSTRSTISGNSTAGSVAPGGGLFARQGATLNDTTVSGNQTFGDGSNGGGISLLTGSLNATRSTIVHNATSGNNAAGGGVFAGSLGLVDSIVALNLSSGVPSEISFTSVPTISANYCLVGSTNGILLINGSGNLLNVDPLIGPLANNGGPTLTHALLPGSPAIDKGGGVTSSGFDQRGSPFLRLYDGDGVGGPRIDMGAVEFQPNPIAGDYNFNGIVDVADYSVWRDTLGSTTDLRADSSGPTVGTPNGIVDQADYDFWKSHFGNTLAASGSAASIAVPDSAAESNLAPKSSLLAPLNPQSEIRNPKLTTLAPPNPQSDLSVLHSPLPTPHSQFPTRHRSPHLARPTIATRRAHRRHDPHLVDTHDQRQRGVPQRSRRTRHRLRHTRRQSPTFSHPLTSSPKSKCSFG